MSIEEPGTVKKVRSPHSIQVDARNEKRDLDEKDIVARLKNGGRTTTVDGDK